jgi:hypothetical protein
MEENFDVDENNDEGRRYDLVWRDSPRDMMYAHRCAGVLVGELMAADLEFQELDAAMLFAVCERWCSRSIFGGGIFGYFDDNRNRFLFLLVSEVIELHKRLFWPTIVSRPLKKFKGSIADFTDSECYEYFRFAPPKFRRFVRLAGLEDREFKLDNGSKYTGEFMLMVSLYYMSKPYNQSKVANEFGIGGQSNVSRIFQFMESYLYDRYGHLVAHDPNDVDGLRMWAPQVENFKRAIRVWHVDGIDTERYRDVIGFVDGTLRPTCRPSQREEDTLAGVNTQRQAYNGHKRLHGLKLQALSFPNGIIGSLTEAVPGRFHDARLMRLSLLNEKFESLEQAAGTPCHLYGDSAYPLLSHVRKASGSARERQVMNRVRTSVEWSFKHVVRDWQGIDFWPQVHSVGWQCALCKFATYLLFFAEQNFSQQTWEEVRLGCFAYQHPNVFGRWEFNLLVFQMPATVHRDVSWSG